VSGQLHASAALLPGENRQVTYNGTLLRPFFLGATCNVSLYFGDFRAINIYYYLYATLLGTSRVEILFRVYRTNSNKTHSLYNYLLNHTKHKFEFYNIHFTNYSPTTAQLTTPNN
jgi:hypothetical protein